MFIIQIWIGDGHAQAGLAFAIQGRVAAQFSGTLSVTEGCIGARGLEPSSSSANTSTEIERTSCWRGSSSEGALAELA